jgi:hypothetical protein
VAAVAAATTAVMIGTATSIAARSTFLVQAPLGVLANTARVVSAAEAEAATTAVMTGTATGIALHIFAHPPSLALALALTLSSTSFLLAAVADATTTAATTMTAATTAAIRQRAGGIFREVDGRKLKKDRAEGRKEGRKRGGREMADGRSDGDGAAV